MKIMHFAVLAMLLTSLPARAQTYGLSDIPPGARPTDMTVYLQVTVSGTMNHVCVGTDVPGVMAWYLKRSEAKLFDSGKKPIGKALMQYSGIPRVRVEAIWEDAQGGKVVSAPAPSGRGALAANSDIGWQRYDVQSREGSGPIAKARSVIRITAWRNIPYSQPCDRSRAGSETESTFSATDLFMK